jgi:hypothetical protein
MDLTLTCEIYHTELGESLLDVARHYSSDKSTAGVKKYLAELIAHNQANLQAMSVDPREPSLPTRMHVGVLCLPEGTASTPHLKRLDIDLARANRKPYEARRTLHKMIAHNFPLPTVASVGMMLGGWQRLENKLPELAAGAAITLPHLYADRAEKRAEKIKQTLEQLDSKIRSISKASSTERKTLITDFLKDWKGLNEDFNQEVKNINAQLAQSKQKVLPMDGKKLISQVRMGEGKVLKNKKLILGSKFYGTLADTAKYAKYTGRTFTGLEAVMIFWKVGEAYEEGGDWQKELFEGVAECLGSAIVGGLVIAFFAGLGWWIIIPAYVGASYGGNWLKDVVQIIEEKNGH